MTKARTPPRTPKHTGTMALWIMTPFGPLYPAAIPPQHVRQDDPEATMVVRTRRREYIEAFRKWCPELRKTEHNPGGIKFDYPWRAAVAPAELAAAVGRMILATDSEIFKPLTEGPEGLANRTLAGQLHTVYTSLWSSQLKLSDGTSSYDYPKYTGSTGGKVSAAYKADPSQCARVGCWWPTGHATCVDCGKPRPAGTTGSVHDYRKASEPQAPAEPAAPESWDDIFAEYPPALSDAAPPAPSRTRRLRKRAGKK